MVSLDGRCSAQAEQRKKPVAVGPLPGAYLSTETNLVPIRGVMRKEFDTGQTRTHTELKRCGPPGPRRFAHVTLGKNKCVRVVRTEALCHGCLHILPRWPRRKSSQPQVQETNLLLER